MTKLQAKIKLQSWITDGIEDWGGVVSDDFKEFAKDYKAFMKKVCEENGWQLVNWNNGHYYCSCFVENHGKYIYMSFSDVRHFSRSWYQNILYRSAKDSKDYSGGSNNYTDLDNIEGAFKRMFERMQ